MVFILILFKDASLLVYAGRQGVKMNADKQKAEPARGSARLSSLSKYGLDGI